MIRLKKSMSQSKNKKKACKTFNLHYDIYFSQYFINDHIFLLLVTSIINDQVIN